MSLYWRLYLRFYMRSSWYFLGTLPEGSFGMSCEIMSISISIYLYKHINWIYISIGESTKGIYIGS